MMKFYGENTKQTILRKLKQSRIIAYTSLGVLVLWMALLIIFVNRSNWLILSILGATISILLLAAFVYFLFRSFYEAKLKRHLNRVLAEDEKSYQGVEISTAKQPMTLASGIKAYEISFDTQQQTVNAYWLAEYGDKPIGGKRYDLIIAGSMVKEAERHEK